jgi:two-component system, OmpR family, response regulator
MRILLVEDDEVLGDALHQSLSKADYAVDWAKQGKEADIALHDQLYDAVVLDLGLPGMDGLEVLRRLRARKILVPVLILSARESMEDRIKGLDLGADDYLTKPFKLPELEARMRALIRRYHRTTGNLIEFGALTLNSQDRTISTDGQLLDLSQRELSVLEVLMLKNGRVVSKESLVESLYSWNDEIGANAIEVYIHRIRKKLEPYGVGIRTMRGLGYTLELISES